MSGAQEIVELAKLASSRHDERRKYEWKISLTFWALILASILKKSSLGLQDIKSYIGIVVCFLYAFIWLRGVWVANKNDKDLYDFFRDQAIEKINNSTSEIPALPPKIEISSLEWWFGFLGDWAMIFHTLVTVTLVVAFYFIDC